MTSPCLTRRLWRTTRLMRALPSSSSSSFKTIRTVSFLFLPFTKTVSPRKSCSVSMVLLDKERIELSSLTASVTLRHALMAGLLSRRDARATHMSELGFFFFLRMAVATSSWCVLARPLRGSFARRVTYFVLRCAGGVAG